MLGINSPAPGTAPFWQRAGLAFRTMWVAFDTVVLRKQFCCDVMHRHVWGSTHFVLCSLSVYMSKRIEDHLDLTRQTWRTNTAHVTENYLLHNWHSPRQVAACRPKCTVSRQTVHLAARMLSPTVKRWAVWWCALSLSLSLWLSFIRRLYSEYNKGRTVREQVPSFQSYLLDTSNPRYVMPFQLWNRV